MHARIAGFTLLTLWECLIAGTATVAAPRADAEAALPVETAAAVQRSVDRGLA